MSPQSPRPPSAAVLRQASPRGMPRPHTELVRPQAVAVPYAAFCAVAREPASPLQVFRSPRTSAPPFSGWPLAARSQVIARWPSSPPQVKERPRSADLAPWLDAAREFEMNTDFDIAQAMLTRGVDFHSLMNIMKAESAGKRTIQALGDKILLSQMLSNLEVPQMDMLFVTQRDVDRQAVYSLVEHLESSGRSESFDMVVKPTHLSNGAGTVIFDRDRWLNEEGGWNKEKLFQHMKKYLAQRADASESAALRSLIPGIVVQPRYRSVVDFKTPLEMRVVTVWGKARLGIWWWGRGVREEKRNVWVVRRPAVPGKLGANDDWEVLHEHSGNNPGFERALALFKKGMPAMAAAAEEIAKAVGAPFLRSDFFIGSQTWGVRLNEVAYGSGADLRRRPEGSDKLVDDGPFVAQILQEGMQLCKLQRPSYFLSKLGVEGSTYETMRVQRQEASGTFKERIPPCTLDLFEELEQESKLPTPTSGDECMTTMGSSAVGKCFGKGDARPGVPRLMRNAALQMAAAGGYPAPIQPGLQIAQKPAIPAAAPVLGVSQSVALMPMQQRSIPCGAKLQPAAATPRMRTFANLRMRRASSPTLMSSSSMTPRVHVAVAEVVAPRVLSSCPMPRCLSHTSRVTLLNHPGMTPRPCISL
eukprot:TRINITY_DN90543_c0_g1_i1.p1 TRINITY_DN90543_c0_g1~~TRINITY_DN90543_c0_g1_i1.p1  ORF type:complete len:644 (-),score=130.40 TRINITY_DN90543_c0_g1_i1:58-1989(-)